ncbi:MAG: hypothetical protein KatS3mg076_0428 [Candidatus Binatia bacterium]|nr:MAG: hypothetical protein KatS3mg076_0428 [Candidatus Binatia bacterium]
MWGRGFLLVTAVALPLGATAPGAPQGLAWPVGQALADSTPESSGLRRVGTSSASDRPSEDVRRRCARLEVEPAPPGNGSATAASTGSAPTAPGAGPEAPPDPPPSREKQLEAELSRERKRRAALEEELRRLREEVSVPPFAEPEHRGQDELSVLREELLAERRENQRLLGALRDLQRRLSSAGDGRAGRTEALALRARLLEIESRQQEVLSSLSRTIAADHRREQELSRQLQELRARIARASVERQPGGERFASRGDAEVESLREENRRLQALLAEERERNARLAAKLKLAGRVTELLFRLRKARAGEEPGESDALPAAP